MVGSAARTGLIDNEKENRARRRSPGSFSASVPAAEAALAPGHKVGPTMTSDMAEPIFQTGMIKAGAALLGGGLMLASVGMAITAIAVTRGAAAWARQRDVSPAALAAGKLEQMRHASLAGAHAWREHADIANGHHARTR